MKGYEGLPLSTLMRQRQIFVIFDEEFREAGWLDVTVLLDSESTIDDLESDGTVPVEVLSRIRERLNLL